MGGILTDIPFTVYEGSEISVNCFIVPNSLVGFHKSRHRACLIMFNKPDTHSDHWRLLLGFIVYSLFTVLSRKVKEPYIYLNYIFPLTKASR